MLWNLLLTAPAWADDGELGELVGFAALPAAIVLGALVWRIVAWIASWSATAAAGSAPPPPPAQRPAPPAVAGRVTYDSSVRRPW